MATVHPAPGPKWVAAALASVLCLAGAHATTPLADQPVFSNTAVPGNLALVLSAEFPTNVSVAHVNNTYASATVYMGYFDPLKCYLYSWNTNETLRHFYPVGSAAGQTCSGNRWSGNFLNWATMQTIDPFRAALTGGYRAVDSTSITLLEKAWASGQGGTGNFPDRSLGSAALVTEATPLGWTGMNMRIQGLGNKMRFSRTGDLNGAITEFTGASGPADNTVWEVSVRVKVCDTSSGAGPLEPNCTAYPNGGSPIWKPTGLLQQYADKIRYSAFGYLNDSNIQRDGGVLRARQKFVGPQTFTPTQLPASNPNAEWDSATGIIRLNPDAGDANNTATVFGVPVSNSGVLNYLNKFGQITPGSYKTFDPVGELYYAAIRYFKRLGNVPEWTDMGGANNATRTTWVDGFPVITTWDDPIQYACQKNFVLGIGDVNTHADKNVPGATGTANEPPRPTSLGTDPVNAVTATNKVGALHGLGASLGTAENVGGCCSNNSALMAGLAYDSNTVDIRPDVASQPQTIGKQTVKTYWLDILEYQTYKSDNQFYLAAKYGGFKVPPLFDPYARATDIPMSWWSTTGETVGNGAQPRPDTYFTAARPDQMVAGLTQAFAGIASDLNAFTTSFSPASPQISTTGAVSYSAKYDAGTWTGEIVASTIVFDPNTGVPTTTEAWTFSSKLGAQITGTGWNTGRRMVTRRDDNGLGVPFRLASLSGAQQAALDTAYRSGNDSGDYLNYLRGDPTHEVASAVTGSAKAYRNRVSAVGDIVGSRTRPVGPPSAMYSEAANPGYAAFRSTPAIANRGTVIYVGSNAGMLHAINGALTGATAGQELWSYVPTAVFQGPSGTPNSNGLRARGNPDFSHRYFVDGTPLVADIDFGRTVGGSGTDWRTLLVGSMGKGGRSYFAIDVTNPATMDTEAAVASKVLWEFSHPDLGFTYGEPTAVKTRKHGWVLIFGSGYNNADGRPYFFIINPRTGALLEKIEAKEANGSAVGASGNQAGMAHVQTFVLDRTDFTADSAYAGDLFGNLWRLDLTAAAGNYPAPIKLAELTDSLGARVPVTSRPLVVIQPVTGKRYVTVGSGRFLDSSDVSSSQPQTFYGVIDGTSFLFSTAATLPAGFSYPIRQNNLKQLVDLTVKNLINPATQIGWWHDLGTGAGNLGWRVIAEPTAFFGIVAFSAMLPNGDVCNASGKSRIYAIDVGDGESQLINAANNTLAYNDAIAGVINDLRWMSENNPNTGQSKLQLIAGSDKGDIKPIKIRPLTSKGLRRLNWRELPLAD